ncbi:phosphocholine-specific phospholipase C [Terriglobus sp. RCC_193]|uniref:phosphocholine-specific phospholipase C n=1 Tax=Terriglobus sp. RCC_193 TaxID=3239218 RepID=UPI0035264612
MRSRRDFLKMAAATAGMGMTPPAIGRALAIEPDSRAGTIQDVQHVVILMQENRSFDHYFGSLRGVRGFGDPHPAPMPNGKSVWYQPTAQVKTKRYHDRGLSPDATHVLPFYLNPKQTTEFQAGTDHGWSSGHLAWNNGHHNQWVNQKQDVLTMGYLKREDVSFHYALADAFTLCDAYHCSVHSNTCPNRIYLWSGTIDSQNRLGKRKNGPGIEERGKTNGYTWTTYPERLQKAGVSWRVYQGGTGLPGSPTDNYTDNSLEFFAQYQVKEGASPKSELVRRGVTDRTLVQFKEDVQKGNLPQVSWVVAPYKYCEHPEASPTDGAYFISLVLDALTSNPEVWNKTVFFINYDENDGLFDHVVPPMPPSTLHANGGGMISNALQSHLEDEFLNLDLYPHEMHPLIPGADPGGRQPIGLGPRVPMLVVSPWSKGGWTCSETFDHTSVLRFLEKRFGVEETNISAWRRSICGDLTSAFDFAQTSDRHIVSYPPPQPIASSHKPYSIPAVQKMPEQEPGTRPARAIGYVLETQVRHEDKKLWLDLRNAGSIGAAFYVYDQKNPTTHPRRYSVVAGDTLSDFWELPSDRMFDLQVYGPNGFFARHAGISQIEQLQVEVRQDTSKQTLRVNLKNPSDKSVSVVWEEKCTKVAGQDVSVAPLGSALFEVPLVASAGWYELSIMEAGSPAVLQMQLAGHVESGLPSQTQSRLG